MTVLTPAKINLGLNIVERRADGYHNLQTVFYPIPLCDKLEASAADPSTASADCTLSVTGIAVEGDTQQNLVCRAYRLLRRDFQLPPLSVRLHKQIPTQAGMGGGSSDASAMLLLLNAEYNLQLSQQQLIDYAAQLGADCPFFIMGKPAYAEGIGERLQPISLSLKGWHLAIVRPPIPVSTREAFALVVPQRPQHCCRDIVQRPVGEWASLLVNDFEQSVFAQHPELATIKQQLYAAGATYAAMSGSGSALFGLFEHPIDADLLFPNCFATCLPL